MLYPKKCLCACDPRMWEDALNAPPICEKFVIEGSVMKSWDEPCSVCGHLLECHTRKSLSSQTGDARMG